MKVLKKYRLVSMLMIMLLTLGALTGCGSSGGDSSGSGSEAGTATIILVDQDGTEYTYSVKATGDNLRNVLHEEGLIDDANFTNTFVETIDGHTALAEDGVLWMMCDENKDAISGFFEEHAVNSGDTLYLIYTVAPNFDD